MPIAQTLSSKPFLIWWMLLTRSIADASMKLRAGSNYAQVEGRSVTFLDQTTVCREEKSLGGKID